MADGRCANSVLHILVTHFGIIWPFECLKTRDWSFDTRKVAATIWMTLHCYGYKTLKAFSLTCDTPKFELGTLRSTSWLSQPRCAPKASAEWRRVGAFPPTPLAYGRSYLWSRIEATESLWTRSNILSGARSTTQHESGVTQKKDKTRWHVLELVLYAVVVVDMYSDDPRTVRCFS